MFMFVCLEYSTNCSMIISVFGTFTKMSEIGKVFCTDILNALRKEQLLILSGEKALDIFSQWTLHYGLDSHEFVVTELIRMDEGDNKDTVKFTQNRHKGKLKR